MSAILTVHSFRPAAGKSLIATNLAYLLALDGYRVALVDANLQAPSLQILLGLPDANVRWGLGEALRGECRLAEVLMNVSSLLPAGCSGRLFFLPSRSPPYRQSAARRRSAPGQQLDEELQQLAELLPIDIFLLDASPGLGEDSLQVLAISTALLVIMRLDQQEYAGTGVLLQLARQLAIPRRMLLINDIPASRNLRRVGAAVTAVYQCAVVGLYPHWPEILQFGSAGIFCQRFPQHHFTGTLHSLARRIAGLLMRYSED